MRRLVPLLLVLLAAAGCGEDEGLDYSLRTPPPYIGGAPIPPRGVELVDRNLTGDDAERLRPVIADWAAAVRQGDFARAANFFTLPTIVSQPSRDTFSLNSTQVAQAFHASLPCGAKLLAAKPDGRYLVATFMLVEVRGRACGDEGDLERVGFVFGDKERPRRFTEWWQLPRPEATVGPEKRPRRAPAATVSDFG